MVLLRITRRNGLVEEREVSREYAEGYRTARTSHRLNSYDFSGISRIQIIENDSIIFDSDK